MEKSDIGVYGLGVMGRNLALNFNDKGFRVSVHNRKLPGEEDLLQKFANNEVAGTNIEAFEGAEAFVASLEKPRKILMMVKAGAPVDSVIAQLVPLLEEGDILIDGGNTHYTDTNRRLEELANEGIRYVGMGISGGEEGARHGPSLMPGGDHEAWPHLQPVVEAVAASSPGGDACCAWMGPQGAGHFVKMVHNGIEYAVMQLIAECYQLMSEGIKMNSQRIAETFGQWNSGRLESYLLEITADIFRVRAEDGTLVLDHILDKAGQKGTGRWTALTALELGVPLPLITEAVFARTMSSFQQLRQEASKAMHVDRKQLQDEGLLKQLQDVLLAGQLVAFAEGFWLLRAAQKEYCWEIPFARVAESWRGGCIIRSALLDPIAEAFREDPDLEHLLLAPAPAGMIATMDESSHSAVAGALEAGFPVPAMAAALSHCDALRSSRLPANLIQAQRDYFGAHRYERLDQPQGTFFHTDWQKQAGSS
ncbi:NADP-dependent phosphogluconate dehydrogenase [Fodinibius sediminis]|uniref:6-phosphogluconate dehydrogenase, decarboxylating n=1 Tax=Fodinibius sediminis TaxID=1214077 RepID=A0A521BIE8_9BACT|nr:NADP-dependent phosphogluconate dehydrogenase [Fodinibius sediminis]SMO46873.1 6-phosphogluconate dehydrogenase [Fodinibius sediminis]